jgi:fructose/tagatose bisphosphate aldolase
MKLYDLGYNSSIHDTSAFSYSENVQRESKFV